MSAAIKTRLKKLEDRVGESPEFIIDFDFQKLTDEELERVIALLEWRLQDNEWRSNDLQFLERVLQPID